MKPHVQADLTVAIDGEVHRVHGDGETLRWDAPHMAGLLDTGAVPQGRRGVAKVADQLADLGLVVEVADPRGPVVTLGRRGSRVSQLLYGSRAARVHRFGIVWHTPTARRAVTVAGVATILAAIAVAGARRR